MEGNTPGASREPQTPLDPDKLLAMTTKWPKYPDRPHRSGRARLTVSRKSLYLRGLWGTEESHDHYDELHKRWREAHRQAGKGAALPAPVTYADGLAEYLRWSRIHQAAPTTKNIAFYAEKFADAHGQIPMLQLTPYIIDRWVDEQRTSRKWSTGTAANAQRFVARIVFWCAKQRLIPSNPLAGMDRIRTSARRRMLADAEYRTLLRGASAAFRRILVALRWTGARPGELRKATWGDVRTDAAGNPLCIVLAEHKTTTTDAEPRDRVIWLVGPAARLVAHLRSKIEKVYHGAQKSSESRDTEVVQKNGENENCTAHIFLSPRGRPWTTQRLCHTLARRRAAVGLPKGAVCYGLRHRMATDSLANGLSAEQLAELMGNSARTVNKHYNHLRDKAAFLREKMRQAMRRWGEVG